MTTTAEIPFQFYTLAENSHNETVIHGMKKKKKGRGVGGKRERECV
jgi:hypothetical protein